MEFEMIKEELIKLNIGEVLVNEPMYKHTSFKVGGPASFYVKCNDVNGLPKLLTFIKENNIPYIIVGKGSNLLFSDQQYHGVVISLNEHFNQIYVNGCTIRAQAGVSTIKLASVAAKAGLSGLEFLGGIPGTVGGAIYMNAGAYKSEIANVIKEVLVLDENYKIKVLSKEEMEFSYRHSILQKQKQWIVLEVVLELLPADVKEIYELMDKRKEKRMLTQPWNLPSAGSVFRNPKEKFAWEYIDECKLRGREIGGAQISLKHPNFIVNNGYASAKDILDLIELVQKEVSENFGVKLHTEIILVNW